MQAANNLSFMFQFALMRSLMKMVPYSVVQKMKLLQITNVYLSVHLRNIMALTKFAEDLLQSMMSLTSSKESLFPITMLLKIVSMFLGLTNWEKSLNQETLTLLLKS